MAVGMRISTEQLAVYCLRWNITELALFGSALREDFDEAIDIDVWVSFSPGTHWSLFELVTMQGEVEALVGRDVDLVERTAIEQSENYLRRKGILLNAEVLYERR